MNCDFKVIKLENGEYLHHCLRSGCSKPDIVISVDSLLRNCNGEDAKSPNIFKKAWSYGTSVARHVLTGMEKRSTSEIERIFLICEKCNKYKDGSCKMCGCRVNKSKNAFLNKIGMARTNCPLGKWGKESVESIPATFVYPYLDCSAEGHELLYSVRSVEKFYQGQADIWIIGDRPDWWEREDHFIHCPVIKGGARIDRANKLKRIMNHPEISEDFFWMQDDIYFIKPITHAFLEAAWTRGKSKDPNTLKKWRPSKGFERQKKFTWEALAKENKPLHDFAAHVPRLYTKSNLKILFRKFDLLKNNYVDDLLYCNYFHNPLVPTWEIGSMMYRALKNPSEQEYQTLSKPARMHNHLNGKYHGTIRKKLSEEFDSQCKWEKEGYEVVEPINIKTKKDTIKPLGHLPKIAVCCITYGRPHIVSDLVGCFVRQDYPNDKCELVILDDGNQLVPGVYYFDEKRVLVVSVKDRYPNIGAKRNAVRNLVSDDVEAITQWDDDDLYMPWALRAMGERIQSVGMAIGNRRYDMRRDKSFRYKKRLTHGICAVQLETFDAVGGYSEKNNCEDREFLSKLKEIGITKDMETCHHYHTYMVVRRDLGTYNASRWKKEQEKRYKYAKKMGANNITIRPNPLPPIVDDWYKKTFSNSDGRVQKYPVYWWSDNKATSENAGDIVTPFLLNEANIKFTKSGMRDSGKILACGSIVGRAKENDIVWGSGAISDKIKPNNKATYLAVRGPLTRGLILKNGGECPEIYGDPALLLPRFYNPKIEKVGKTGIVLHYADYANGNVRKDTSSKGDIFTTWTNNLQEFINKILSYETIVSSSLHGLIIAHAYGIPARWIRLGDRLVGGNFKFHDYLDSVGIARYEPNWNTQFDKVDLQIDLDLLMKSSPFVKFFR